MYIKETKQHIYSLLRNSFYPNRIIAGLWYKSVDILNSSTTITKEQTEKHSTQNQKIQNKNENNQLNKKTYQPPTQTNLKQFFNITILPKKTIENEQTHSTENNDVPNN